MGAAILERCPNRQMDLARMFCSAEVGLLGTIGWLLECDIRLNTRRERARVGGTVLRPGSHCIGVQYSPNPRHG